MTNRMHRTLALATLLLGATAALAACGSTGTDTGTAQPAVPASVPAPITQTTESATGSTPPFAPPIAEPTGTQQPGITPTQRPANAPRTGDHCPVDDVVLLRIIHKSDNFAPTSGLRDLTCYRGWAAGGQVVDRDWWAKHGPVQPVMFVFRFDPDAGRWTIASAGTGGDCPTSMPADVRKHFTYCRN
jgi:hypothetical protein